MMCFFLLGFNLPGISSSIHPSATAVGLKGAVAANSTKVCIVSLGSSIDPAFSLTTEAYVVDKLTGRLPTCSLAKFVDFNTSDLPLTDLKCAHMDLLLGGDIYSQIMFLEVRKDSEKHLIAQRTVFGWIVTGKIPQPNSLSSVASFFGQLALDAKISRFWKVEEIPTSKVCSPEDRFCEDLYRRTTYRTKEGRYAVALPFKLEFSTDLNLGPSRKSALAQFLRNESRMLKNPEVKEQYDQVIGEYLTLGHISRIEHDSVYSPKPSCYLPHHAVFKLDSTTTKLRVVFNASGSSSNGLSLNNVLYTGPILQS